MFLLQTSTLTINRFLPGYYQGGDWVSGGLDTPFAILCNIQPYREGKERAHLPEGITTNDIVIVYTQSELQVADQFTSTDGDYFDLDGFTYKVYADANWSRYGLSIDHHKYLAIRKDFPTGGDL